MGRMSRNFLSILVLVGLISLAGCAGLFQHLEAPHVSLADVRLRDSTLFEQRYVLFLRIQNPNTFAIPVQGLQYNLWIFDITAGRDRYLCQSSPWNAVGAL